MTYRTCLESTGKEDNVVSTILRGKVLCILVYRRHISALAWLFSTRVNNLQKVSKTGLTKLLFKQKKAITACNFKWYCLLAIYFPVYVKSL